MIQDDFYFIYLKVYIFWAKYPAERFSFHISKRFPKAYIIHQSRQI